MKTKARYYFFLFKWFLIGKNHCDIPPFAKRYFWVLHKALWIVITLSLVFSLYALLNAVNGG
ncbi:hypothetical protein DMB92_09035 [Campylobacter sp. MIT 99-7217]|uniref:hypothetical protein n=1 Tax=Campylobacter sp. MIT 99-7217 TaxID=535091 RepID=UPI00115997A3|nr:hypothetical protein [Campylobacter sp. MIT 99-7217]TQR28704.1 hypothetical protein DMB92_09035 [Campylobacter sp. MIT 99-7217]